MTKEIEQKAEQLRGSIYDLERRFQEGCQEYWLEPEEDSAVLKTKIMELV